MGQPEVESRRSLALQGWKLEHSIFLPCLRHSCAVLLSKPGRTGEVKGPTSVNKAVLKSGQTDKEGEVVVGI